MHSRARGNSGSKKPLNPSKPSWIRYKPKEAELLIVKLGKEGKKSSEIGVILRDIYGIPSVKTLIEKKINEILKEKSLVPEVPEDVNALIKKSIILRKHLEKNKKDMNAVRGLQLTESKIKRLVKYYKKTERLAESWKYSPQEVKMMHV